MVKELDRCGREKNRQSIAVGHVQAQEHALARVKQEPASRVQSPALERLQAEDLARRPSHLPSVHEQGSREQLVDRVAILNRRDRGQFVPKAVGNVAAKVLRTSQPGKLDE